VQLIISVDCGIRGADAARRAQELGVDDHHRSPRAGYGAAAGAGGDQSKRHDCSYPDKYLAASASRSSWFRPCASGRPEAWLPGFIKVAAIGTLADVVRWLARTA
jgi:single-stranded DNA-specific DHH superfamily exonuclease